MPNPLYRISVALKLAKPYQPCSTPDVSTLARFLSESKKRYLEDIRGTPGKGGDWTVVMGNEAGDLDSVASSIAFAWVQSEVHKKPTIPLIQTEHDDFTLRVENLHALELAGVNNPKEQLLSISDFAGIKPFPSSNFALVDHNRISPQFLAENPTAQVVAVVDHHEDEGLYPDANPRILAPAGSCASHVAGLCTPELPAELATLLLCAILIDTGGLKPGGKALTEDYQAAGFVASRSTFAPSLPPKLVDTLLEDPHAKSDALYSAQAIKDLTSILSTKKSDLAHLSGRDLLRRDYKQATYKLSWSPGEPAVESGLSTVPVSLGSWGTNGKLEEASLAWMKERDLAILGVLTSFRDGSKPGKSEKGKRRREIAWFVREDLENKPANGTAAEEAEVPKGVDYDALAARLWKGLEASTALKLRKHKKFDLEKAGNLPAGVRARVYNQKNVDASRKVIAPLLKQIVEGDAATADAADAVKK